MARCRLAGGNSFWRLFLRAVCSDETADAARGREGEGGLDGGAPPPAEVESLQRKTQEVTCTHPSGICRGKGAPVWGSGDLGAAYAHGPAGAEPCSLLLPWRRDCRAVVAGARSLSWCQEYFFQNLIEYRAFQYRRRVSARATKGAHACSPNPYPTNQAHMKDNVLYEMNVPH